MASNDILGNLKRPFTRSSASSAEPEHPVAGMGAIPTEAGVAFRVWAPHADAVSVVGDFNEWTAGKHSLSSEHNGYWYGFVADAQVGDEYKFALTAGDTVLQRVDPYALEVTNSVGNGVIYDHSVFDWGDDVQRIPGHHELVIYEMHIGSFYDTDENNPGTFKLALEKLRHLRDLGVNALQIMPIAEFAGDFSWGYNPAHIFAVETIYGGPNGFKEFIKTAHAEGFAVILDVVYNHFGPSDLDLWQFDGWSENGKGGIYFYNDHRSTTPWGDTRPDYGRGEVRQFIYDNAMMWLRDYHVDGLRFDMTPYIHTVGGGYDEIPEGWSLMRWINESVREQFPGRILIAEDMHKNPAISQHGNGGAAFHAQWDSAFVHPVREAVTVADDGHRDLGSVATALNTKYNDDAFQRVVYSESHDEVANGKARIPSEVDAADPEGWHAQKRSTAAAALVFTAPGIPMLFQGQELLQGEWFRDDVPLDWQHNTDFRGIVRCYSDLVDLRRNVRGTTKGLSGHHINVFHLNDHDNLMAFQRWADHGVGDDVVVVVNLSHFEKSNYRIGFPCGGRWTCEFNSDAKEYSVDFAGHPSGDVVADGPGYDGFGASAEITVAPYSVLIYSYAG